MTRRGYTAWHDEQRRWATARAVADDPRTQAWLRELDAGGERLVRAQAALRLPVAERGLPPEQPREPRAPQTAAERWGGGRPVDRGPRPESLVAPEGTRLTGAYARRAAAKGSS